MGEIQDEVHAPGWIELKEVAAVAKAKGKDLRRAADAGDVATVAQLLADGVNVDLADSSGQTALMTAAAEGETEVVKLLVEADANVNLAQTAEDTSKLTPLHIAANRAHVQICKLLIASGAELKKKDKKGRIAAAMNNAADHAELKALFAKAQTEEGLEAIKREVRPSLLQREMKELESYGFTKDKISLFRGGRICSFWFLRADKLREAVEPALLMMQTLRAHWSTWLVQKTVDFELGVKGAYREKYLIVSHRWQTSDSPDPDCTQALAIQAHLLEHPMIQYVWYDVRCRPSSSI